MSTISANTPVKRKAPRGTPFTKENAKAFSLTANQAKRARAEMRRKLLKTVIDEGLEKYFAEAIKNADEKMMNVIEKASKLTGVDFTSSEESVQRLDVKADANLKTQHTGDINITFKDAT